MKTRMLISSVLLVTCVTAGCVEKPAPSGGEETGAAAAPVARDAAIRLEGVDEPLTLPAPEGSNRILTAHVSGPEPTSVRVAVGVGVGPGVPLVRVAAGEYQINLHSHEACDALQDHGDGEFSVVAEFTDGSQTRSIPVRYRAYATPERLADLGDKAVLTVYQRSTRHIPGSDGELSLTIGDITRGQVLVGVTGAAGTTIVEMKSMRQGEALPLPLKDRCYVLVLEKLMNFLTSEDYAEFALLPDFSWQALRIERLLKRIAASDATFIREGNEIDGATFAGWLRMKWRHSQESIESLDAFIEQIASRSSTTGDPYQVKLPSGEVVEAGVWLKAQAAQLEAGGECDEEAEAVATTKPAEP